MRDDKEQAACRLARAGITRNVFFAGIVSLLMDVSSEMVYPLVPLFLSNVLGASKSAIGVIEGIAEATASLLKVSSGALSDRFGKRKLPMAIGYGVSTLSRPILAVSGAWSHVLGARFIDRFGKGIRTAPRDAIIAESTDKKNLGLAFGFHRSMDTVGASLGPAVAFGLLYYLAWDIRAVFWASAIPGILAVAAVIFFIKEKKGAAPKAVARPESAFKSLLSNLPFRNYLIVITVFSLGSFSDAFLILRAVQLGVANELIPIVYLVFNIIYAAISVPIGRVADKIGLRRTVLAGLFYCAVIYAGFAVATTSVHIWILFPLYGVYKGLTDGVQRAYLASITPPDKKATTFGAYHTMTGLGALPASIMAGWLWDAHGAHIAFLYGAVLAVIAALIFAAQWARR